MGRRFVAAVASVLASLTLVAAPANAACIDQAFQNTVTLTDAAGAVTHYYFEPNGSYAEQRPNGERLTGAWEVRGERLCLTPEGEGRYCIPYQAERNVGEAWEIQTATRELMYVAMVSPGR